MNALTLAIKNILYRPLRSSFNIILIAFSVTLIISSILINEQLKNHFEKNLAKIDLILTAKGSPLQAILCNLYHVDAPTGNIPVKALKAFLNPKHPLIKSSLPLSLGDNANGFRIVGTTIEYLDWYNLSIEEGKQFTSNMDAVLGHEVAKQLKLKIGDKFLSGHGLVEEEDNDHLHHNEFTVVGILSSSGQVSDRLIYTPISSYWLIHNHHSNDGEAKNEAHDHTSESHSDAQIVYKDSLANVDQSISSLLLRFNGRNIQTLNFGRNINENTDLMSAYPAIEMNRLYEITGSISDVLFYIALLVTLLSALSIFISLIQSAHERKKEISMMRLTGVSRSFIFNNILFEGLLILLIGFLLGIISAHLLVELLGHAGSLKNKYGIHGFAFYRSELYTFALLLILVIFASLYPSYKAYKVNVHESLQS
jgi:putative ABC transport system permease protein